MTVDPDKFVPGCGCELCRLRATPRWRRRLYYRLPRRLALRIIAPKPGAR